MFQGRTRSILNCTKRSQENMNRKPNLFQIEKERRDQLFRAKNAANFNVTGQKSFAKKYPIKRIKKVFYNDILSYDEFIAGNVDAAVNDPELEVKPMSRQLKEVVDHTQNIVRVKAQNMNQALQTYAAEAQTEFIEKEPFGDTDDDEYENPDKLPSSAERRKRKRIQARQAKLLQRAKQMAQMVRGEGTKNINASEFKMTEEYSD